MFAILSILYILFILTVSIVSFFMVTRLQEYSINPTFTKPLIIIFITITIFLIIINFSLFFQVPFEEIFFNNIYF